MEKITVMMKKVKVGRKINTYEGNDLTKGVMSLYIHQGLSAPDKVQVTIEDFSE